MSKREYGMTVIASLVGSVGALFWALADEPYVAGACMVLSGWATWRVFRCDVGSR